MHTARYIYGGIISSFSLFKTASAAGAEKPAYLFEIGRQDCLVVKEGEKMKKTHPDIMVVRDLNYFDAKLKKLLGSKGKLAEVTNLSYSSVTHMNTVGVSYGVAARVADVLHASIDELFVTKKA